MGKNKALDWAKICAESGGRSTMIPKEFIERAKAFIKEVDEINKMQRAIIRRQADLDIIGQNFWYDVRKSLEAMGIKDAFTQSGIDFDSDALKDGFYVANLYDAKMGAPMRRPRAA